MQSVEDDLIKKEIKLENKVHNIESWGEDIDGEHYVNMKPLFPHLIEAENNAISKAKEFSKKL